MMDIDSPALVHAEPPIIDSDDDSTRSAGSSMPNNNIDSQMNVSIESVENEPPNSTPINTGSGGMKRLEDELESLKRQLSEKDKVCKKVLQQNKVYAGRIKYWKKANRINEYEKKRDIDILRRKN
ncbi:hypothetical protein QAD02_016511 [Eretmocerus hayati]|uniref:Uncharacterized protein n=1 Tax=Eretmocerus hayati TaxID=131215 RepID=A0ACC2PAT6_9HYME|nr:hypothetical protein QAD02_016511 [Eretmocerus hayati]